MIFMTQMKLYFPLFSIGSLLLLISIVFLFYHYFVIIDLVPETENLYIGGAKLIEPAKEFTITDLWIDFAVTGFWCILISMFIEDFFFYIENIRPLKKMFK